MKDYNGLINRFNDIPELPVSEEMLGAYAEGALQGAELYSVSQQISSDSSLNDILNEATETYADDLLGIDYPWDVYGGDYGYWELGLPPVLTFEDLQSDCVDTTDEDIYVGNDRVQEEKTHSLHDNMSRLRDNFVNSNIMDNKNRKVYGYEPNKAENKYDPIIDQGPRPSCAVRSQEIILRDYGIVIPQEELIAFASQQGWYSDDPKYGGTPRHAVGNLLEACGIPTMRTENATIHDIIAELRAGHRVIVSGDANELWVKQEPTLYKRVFGEFKNNVQDAVDKLNGVQGANHALIVAGVTVNPKDPSDLHVTLIDSGTGDVCIEYSLKDFQNALEDSNSYMVSTTIPAPYQYNYETHEMEPSSFITNYYPSMVTLPVGLSNEFSLGDSYYEKYTDYEPVYNVIDESFNNSEQDVNTGDNITLQQRNDTSDIVLNVASNDEGNSFGNYDDNIEGDNYVDNEDEDTSQDNILFGDDNNDSTELSSDSICDCDDCE